MIDTKVIQSRSRANVTHTLYIHEGKAVGCSCEHRQFHPWTPCPHMTQHEQAQRDAERTAYLNVAMSLGWE